MKNLSLLAFVIVVFICGCSKKTYRLVEAEKLGNFIIPPKTDFRPSETAGLKHQYYYALFPGIVSNYEDAVNNLSGAFYWSGNLNYFDTVQTKKLFRKHIVKKNLPLGSSDGKIKDSKESTHYQSGTLDNLHTLYFIQFDFKKILSESKSLSKTVGVLDTKISKYIGADTSSANVDSDKQRLSSLDPEVGSIKTKGVIIAKADREFSRDTTKAKGKRSFGKYLPISPIDSNYHEVAENLLVEIANQEEGSGGRYNWPNTISQNIVEKIFEMIPVIESSALERFGYIKTDVYSLVLLNPKIKLKIDFAAQTVYPPDPRTKIMTWVNSTTSSFYRDEKGDIKQLPYLSLDPARYPLNQLNDANDGGNTNYYNIANNADIELFSFARNSRFIALFQPIQRPNVLTEKADCGQCLVSEHDCSSQLVFEKNPNEIFNPQKRCDNGIPVFGNVGVYSKRNLIHPEITIVLDQQTLNIPFGRTIKELIQTGYLPRNFELYRMHNGIHVKFNFNHFSAMQTLLLPMDYLKTKY